MSQTTPLRQEIATEFKWHIEDIYASDELWAADLTRLTTDIPKLKASAGTLGQSGEVLLSYLTLKDDLTSLLHELAVYANQKSHEDMGNNTYQDMTARMESIDVDLNSATAFEAPELLALPELTLKTFIDSNPSLEKYRHYLEDILRQKPHTLSQEQEELLSMAMDMAPAPSNIFAMFNNADLNFPAFTDAEGHSYELTHGRFISYMENPDVAIRKAAFESLYSAYYQYRNTLATTFQANVKNEYFFTKARNYPSTLEMHLFANAISTDVYDSLIEKVHEYLPYMHRYVALRKKTLGLAAMHMYDLYTPMVPQTDLKYTFDEAKELVIKALAPLGEDYGVLLRRSFDEGWIDVYENKGKRSGAYSWGTYSSHPFILLNFQGNLNDVFTLAHELGHALHSYYSNHTQDFINSNYCIFVAEVASTCNESLLMNYLLNTLTTPEEKAYLLDHHLNSYRTTLFRQTMFAEFEKITHGMVANGETLTADTLARIYHDLNVLYYGPEIEVDSQIDMEWARIPHFYTPFYVYQYATGFSASAAFSSLILEEGQPAVERYKTRFLSAGSAKYPLDILADAGVDMRQGEPVARAMEQFASTVESAEALFNLIK